jgi:arabinogalactan endo-1,4-beta-galactosidase
MGDEVRRAGFVGWRAYSKYRTKFRISYTTLRFNTWKFNLWSNAVETLSNRPARVDRHENRCHRRRMGRRGVSVVVALAVVGFAVVSPAAVAEGRSGPVVNVALGATASANSGDAALAVDGDGATAWCPSGAEGALTIDLGRVRPLEGFGLTLRGDGAVRVEIGVRPTEMRAVAATAAGGTTTWLRSQVTARYVRVTATACLGEARVMARAERGMVLGDDLSFAIQEATVGNVFRDRGVVRPPEQILAAHGSNFVRLRLWNEPPGGYSDLNSVLAMARRATAAGMRILLDFHYSDFWADPQTQNTPKAWQGQDLTTLAGTVRRYTRDVLNALVRQGTPASMVAIGNEIRNGMLWPAGQLDWTTGAGWDALGTLLRAGAAGAAEAIGPTPLIQIHFDQGGDNAFSRTFFDHIVAQRVPFDIIALSYYPFWHGTLTQLRTNVNDLAARYGKPVAIAETQYGWTLENGDSLGNFLWQESQLVPGYPASPAGQLTFVSDLASILAAVPNGRGLGLFYWQPEWIPGVGWTPGAGTPNDNLTMFDFAGNALPAVQFANPFLA